MGKWVYHTLWLTLGTVLGFGLIVPVNDASGHRFVRTAVLMPVI